MANPKEEKQSGLSKNHVSRRSCSHCCQWRRHGRGLLATLPGEPDWTWESLSLQTIVLPEMAFQISDLQGELSFDQRSHKRDKNPNALHPQEMTLGGISSWLPNEEPRKLSPFVRNSSSAEPKCSRNAQPNEASNKRNERDVGANEYIIHFTLSSVHRLNHLGGSAGEV